MWISRSERWYIDRQIYEFEEQEIRKIIRALKDAVSSVESRFDAPRGKGGGGFKL